MPGKRRFHERTLLPYRLRSRLNCVISIIYFLHGGVTTAPICFLSKDCKMKKIYHRIFSNPLNFFAFVTRQLDIDSY